MAKGRNFIGRILTLRVRQGLVFIISDAVRVFHMENFCNFPYSSDLLNLPGSP